MPTFELNIENDKQKMKMLSEKHTRNTKKLDFEFYQPPRGSTKAYIYLKNYSINQEKRILLTPEDCVTKSEMNCYIDNLIKNLESIRKKAAVKLK